MAIYLFTQNIYHASTRLTSQKGNKMQVKKDLSI